MIDVRRMQALTQEVWRLEGPGAPQHVGDLAWQMFSAGRGDWEVRFWEHGGRDVAWGWAQLPGLLDSCVHPHHREEALFEELFDWFERAAVDEPVIWVQSNDGAMLDALARRGYRDSGRTPIAFHHRELRDVGSPVLPPGFRLRSVEPSDTEPRVELHRVVWAPSRFTLETYADVRAAWPYRTDLDCVVEAPDGRLAAYCLAWLDEANAAGELEPVGTHPDFRRLGLGAAVCTFALSRLAEEGATQAMVYAELDGSNPGPRRLYESIGFREVSRALRFQAAAG